MGGHQQRYTNQNWQKVEARMSTKMKYRKWHYKNLAAAVVFQPFSLESLLLRPCSGKVWWVF